MELTFKLARNRMNLSLEEVAKKVGISYPTMQKLEKDTSKIKMETATKLANIYCIDPINLYYGKESDYINMVRETYQTRYGV
ncbi:DNA-binding XRE family transcriptional regulator [Bacillus sp. RC55]|uniref:helix-turn-helix domain-containing protein n=1 Tax=unclassified Bacillus (in: firmicutes) TaxID=185979 RepID=UPI0038381740